jgi:hypothetical protein
LKTPETSKFRNPDIYQSENPELRGIWKLQNFSFQTLEILVSKNLERKNQENIKVYTQKPKNS